jgi:hypothetical protein
MSKSFYIQVRGKKQGPFTTSRLRHMAKQGRFGRQHRVSTDGRKCKAAEEFPELFSAEGERKTRQTAAAGSYGGDSAGAAAATPPGTNDSQGWFYSHDGQQYGPASFEVIRHARQTGTLTADDLVWTAGMTEWKKADKAFPGLFSEKGDAGSSASGNEGTGPGGTPKEADVTSHAPMCNQALYSLICSFVPVIGSIPAVILGHMALSEIHNSETHMDGRKLALTGLTLGYSVILAGVLYGLFMLSATLFDSSPGGEFDPQLYEKAAASQQE